MSVVNGVPGLSFPLPFREGPGYPIYSPWEESPGECKWDCWEQWCFFVLVEAIPGGGASQGSVFASLCWQWLCSSSLTTSSVWYGPCLCASRLKSAGCWLSPLCVLEGQDPTEQWHLQSHSVWVERNLREIKWNVKCLAGKWMDLLLVSRMRTVTGNKIQYHTEET